MSKFEIRTEFQAEFETYEEITIYIRDLHVEIERLRSELNKTKTDWTPIESVEQVEAVMLLNPELSAQWGRFQRSGKMPKQKPILFSAPMVRAILDGRKTQTRRVCKSPLYLLGGQDIENSAFQKGDILWVRETTIIAPRNFADPDDTCISDNEGYPRYVQYIATHPDTEAAENYGLKKTPSIFMPKWAARIWLEVTNVRVERVQEISDSDAEAEGVASLKENFPLLPVRRAAHYHAFAHLWDSINAKRGFGWDTNPWVWVYEFKQVEVPDAESK